MYLVWLRDSTPKFVETLLAREEMKSPFSVVVVFRSARANTRSDRRSEAARSLMIDACVSCAATAPKTKKVATQRGAFGTE